MADHRIAQHRLRCHGQPSTVGTPVGFWEQYGLHWPFQELPMAKPNLSSMSVDALLRLRDEIEQVLTRRVAQLRDELSRLGRQIGSKAKVRGRSPLKGRTIPVKYKDRSGNTWAGRGAQPAWLREKLKAGAKLGDFAVHKTAASRKASPKKSKTRRRAKR
jgi:DNA-binding protein H-NS